MIKSLTIRNCYGAIYLKMEFGQITVVRGGNGTGKSTILKSIIKTFKGGYDPAMVRDPEAPGAGSIVVGEPPVEGGKRSLPHTKARAELVLADGHRIVRTVDKDRRTSTVECFSADGEKVPMGPQEYLDMIAPVAAFDPVAFLRAEPEKRQKIVMDFLKIPLRPEEVQALIRGDWWVAHYKPQETAFANIDRMEKAAEERRRDANRDLTKINNAVDVLRRGTEDLNAASVNWKEKAEVAERAHSDADAAQKADLASVESESLAARQGVWKETDAETTKIETKLRADIRDLEQKAETEKAKVMATREEKLKTIESMTATEKQRVLDDHAPTVETARAAHQEAKSKLEAYNKATGLRSHIAAQEAEAREHAQTYREMDEAVTALRKLRKDKMSETPIPGLEMREGMVYYDGLPLDGGINTAKQVEVAVKIAAHSLNEESIPFMILDNAEMLDKETLEGFLAGAKGAGFQIVYGEVSRDGEPLSVETVNAN
jgi:hypothetical protein